MLDTTKSYFENVDAKIKDIKELASSYYLFRAFYSLLSFLLAVFNEVFAWYYLLPAVTLGSGFKAWVNISEARASDSMNNNLWQKSILNSFLFLGGLATIFLLAATAYAVLRLLPIILTCAYVAKFIFKTAQVLLYSWRYFRAAPGSERRKECLGRIKRYGFSAVSSLTAAITTTLITICDVISGGTSLFFLLGAALVVNVSNTIYVAKNDLMKKSDEISDILKNLKHVKDKNIRKKLLSNLIKKKILSLEKEVKYYKKLEEKHSEQTTSYSGKIGHKIKYWMSFPASWAGFKTAEEKTQYFLNLNAKIETPAKNFLDRIKKPFYNLKLLLFSSARTIEERKVYLDQLKTNADRPIPNLLAHLSQVSSNTKLALSVAFNYKSIKKDKLAFLKKLLESPPDSLASITEHLNPHVITGETEALLKAVKLIDSPQSSSSHYDESLLTTLKSLEEKEDREKFLCSIIQEKINNTVQGKTKKFLSDLLNEVNKPAESNLKEYLELQEKIISTENIFSPHRTNSIQILFEAVVTHKYIIERDEGIADFHNPGCQKGHFYFTELHQSIESIKNPEHRAKFIINLLEKKITSLRPPKNVTDKDKDFALTWLKKWIESNLTETSFCTPYTKKTKTITNMAEWIEHFKLDDTFKEVLKAPSEGKAGETKALIVGVEKYLKMKDTLLYHKQLRENSKKEQDLINLKDPEERKQLILKLLEDKILSLAPSVKVSHIKSVQKTYVLKWLKNWIESNLVETTFCTPYTKQNKIIANIDDWFVHFKQDKQFSDEVESAYFANETSETNELIHSVQKYLRFDDTIKYHHALLTKQKRKDPSPINSCCGVDELLSEEDESYDSIIRSMSNKSLLESAFV